MSDGSIYAMDGIIRLSHESLCVFLTGSSVIVSYPTTTLRRRYWSTPRVDRHAAPSGMRSVSEWPRRERSLP